jgi:hypothetical protein
MLPNRTKKYKEIIMVEVKSNTIAVAGYVSGIWDNESKSFKIRRGKTKNDKKYQIFEIKVASKDKDSGSWTNGKGLKVMLWGDEKIEDRQEIGILGKLTPDNYENKDGKEIRGLMVMAFETFVPDAWDNKESKGSESSSQKEEELAW